MGSVTEVCYNDGDASVRLSQKLIPIKTVAGDMREGVGMIFFKC